MQARVDWVLIIFGTQVIKKKRPVRSVFPDYLSVSYDYDIFDWFISTHPHILISLGSCALACILASSFSYVCVYLFVSSHPYILVSSGGVKSRNNLHVWYIWLVNILAFSDPYILKFLCIVLYPRILTSSYPCLCVLACILASSYLQVHIPFPASS